MNAIEIPVNDPSWSRLSDDVREKARLWHELLKPVFKTKNKAKMFEMIAASMMGRDGFSADTVKRRFLRVRREGWAGYVNWAKVSGKEGLPSLFIEYWRELLEKHPRDTTGVAAHEAFARQYHRWRAGDHQAAIAGWEDCPEADPATGLPPGCTYRNLMRLKSSKAERALSHRGIAAAREFLPHCLQDVSLVRFLEYVIFDDVELDFYIQIPGVATPVKLRLLVAMDLSSRVILGYGVRPAIPRADGVEDGLKLRDMKCIVARVLRQWGHPIDWKMTLIVENATAKVTHADEQALAEISDGQIAISRTSMIVGQVFEFRDKASGNSWGKAWLESFFNPLHNKLSIVEGQKGRRYDLAPAELEGRRRELASLVKVGQHIPLALRQQFRWPFKGIEEAMQEIGRAFAELNERENHSLQGFDLMQLWRLNDKDSWKKADELVQYPELIGKVQMTTRLETPLERLHIKLAAARRKELPDCSLCRLMDEHALVTYKSFQFAFTFEKKDYVFLPSDALLARLKEGEVYLAWFDPSDLTSIYLTRPKPHLGWVGKVTRFAMTHRGDLEAAKESIREKTRMLNHAMTRVQSRNIGKLHRRIDTLDHNTNVLADAAALDVEVDAVTPQAPQVPADAPESVREMTEDLHDRATAKVVTKARARQIAQRVARIGEEAMDQILDSAPQPAAVETQPTQEAADDKDPSDDIL